MTRYERLDTRSFGFLSSPHDYALFPPGDAGHLDRRKQAPHLAANRIARQRSARSRKASCRAPISPKSKRGADKWFADLPGLVARQKELENTLNHDVIAFTTNVAENINDAASRWLHFGLTSSDVVDTAFAVQMVQSADILIAGREGSCAKSSPPGAQGIQVHALHWPQPRHPCRADDLRPEAGADARRIWPRAANGSKRAREAVAVGKLSGAVGTSAHLSPRIEAFVCKKLGLRPAPIATQVVQRDMHAEFMTALALVGASIERWAAEFRHLQRTEVLEAEELFAKGQKGSSAMPHKRNPITCERLTGLARVLRGNAIAALENVALWHERDISHSSRRAHHLPRFLHAARLHVRPAHPADGRPDRLSREHEAEPRPLARHVELADRPAGAHQERPDPRAAYELVQTPR